MARLIGSLWLTSSFPPFGNLNGFFQVERAIFFDGHFTVYIENVFQFRADILDHVKGLTAACTRAADEDDGLVCGQGLDFFLKTIHRNVDRGLQAALFVFIRIAYVNQIDGFGTLGDDSTEFGMIDAALLHAALDGGRGDRSPSTRFRHRPPRPGSLRQRP